MSAWSTNRQLNINRKKNVKTTEKLSSGYRINRAADDAAGLSMSEKMRRQIRGLNQSADNIQEGVGYVQTAEGSLNECNDLLQRG
ncbi:MAG: flagellin, partial [Acetatifactor sp.]|nr:flagellin [Acetatifactor sp.]